MPCLAKNAEASVFAGEKVLDSIAKPAIAIFGFEGADSQESKKMRAKNNGELLIKKRIKQ